MIAVRPLAGIDATVRVPGSKSYTQRAMAISALAGGESRLADPLLAEDTLALAEALRLLGIDVRSAETEMVIRGGGGRIARPPRPLQMGNNGTGIRLLAGLASLGRGPVVLTGDPRLCERPMKPLLDALCELGATVETDGGRGYPPVTIRGGRPRGGRVVLRDIGSSQYVSSLLIAAPFARMDTTLVLEGKIPSLPYIALTIETMAAFGVEVATEAAGHYRIPSGQRYRPREYPIEGDASSASYFALAATLLQGRVRIENLVPETRQGDIGFLALLERLGSTVRRGERHVEVTGQKLPAGEIVFDLSAMPDIVPTLAILCALRPGRSVICNVAHLRIKESDRIAALAAELGRTGIAVEELPDGLVIDGGSPRGARIETYSDHRIAMAFAIMGLVVPGIEIEGEGAVAKSFPGFWNALAGLAR